MVPIPWCLGMPMPVGSLHSNTKCQLLHVPTWLSRIAAVSLGIVSLPPQVLRHVDTVSGAPIYSRTRHCCSGNWCVKLVSYEYRPLSPFGLLRVRRYAALGQTMCRLTPVLSQGKSIDLSTATTAYESTVPLDVRCFSIQLTIRSNSRHLLLSLCLFWDVP